MMDGETLVESSSVAMPVAKYLTPFPPYPYPDTGTSQDTVPTPLEPPPTGPAP